MVLKALFDRLAVDLHSELFIRPDGMTQAGPDPISETAKPIPTKRTVIGHSHVPFARVIQLILPNLVGLSVPRFDVRYRWRAPAVGPPLSKIEQ
jgi:hypothetical protein